MATKLQCTTCQEYKEPDFFHNSKNEKNGKYHVCKECRKKRPQHSKKYVNTLINRNKQYVSDILKQSSCIDCGYSNWLALEFDHIGDKCNNISTLVGTTTSIATIQSEIDKCEIRCCNCHRIKTIKQFNWNKEEKIIDTK